MSEEWKEASYFVVSYYWLGKILDVNAERQCHWDCFHPLDVRCRVYISKTGVNAQLSIRKEQYSVLQDWIEQHPFLSGVLCKVQEWHEHAFPRLTIKTKRQLVAFDREVDCSQVGRHVSPAEWRSLLERDQPPHLLDIRNDYEWKVGHFVGSAMPTCTSSREFVDQVDLLKEQLSPDSEIMMYCTGGIRCELFSSLLLGAGFSRVYQLHGGILEYGRQEGMAHWKGKLFVFDDRSCVEIGDGSSETIATCNSCKEPADMYYNCANMECNGLFISCSACLAKTKGCCQESCQSGQHVRRCLEGEEHKPFRRKGYYLSSLAGGRT